MDGTEHFDQAALFFFLVDFGARPFASDEMVGLRRWLLEGIGLGLDRIESAFLKESDEEFDVSCSAFDGVSNVVVVNLVRDHCCCDCCVHCGVGNVASTPIVAVTYRPLTMQEYNRRDILGDARAQTFALRGPSTRDDVRKEVCDGFSLNDEFPLAELDVHVARANCLSSVCNFKRCERFGQLIFVYVGVDGNAQVVHDVVVL